MGSVWGEIEKLEDGVLIEVEQRSATGPRRVRVQVCGDGIFRVTATAEKEFSTRESLIVLRDQLPAAAFSISEEEDAVAVSTAKLTAKIAKETGEVVFCDHAGREILKEKAGGGKVITAAEVMGEKTYHIQQVFDSPEGEAFYGLGQHQNGIMNWRGHSADLWQYNIVASVPFVFSSRNYGILWDNNSRTKFGDVREYRSLDATLTLYDKDGEEGGLTAEYFGDAEFKKEVASRRERVINHESLQDQDGYPEGFKPDWNASIRWSGAIASDAAGEHTFRLYSSHFIKMKLDGKTVVDTWRQNWCPWTQIVTLNMEAGKQYSIELEWIPNGGYIGLRHLGPAEDAAKETMSLYSEVADQIDYYFIYGANADEVISGYRTLTGKAPMMPKWAMGLWQCRERYKTQEELLEVAREFRRRGLPLDNIVQDWFYWPEDQWGDHRFDPQRFPEPEEMIRRLHEDLNVQLMISVWPKFYVGTEHYKQFEENGWLYPRNVEKKERDWVGQGFFSTFYDPYSEGARKLFWEQINERLFRKGVDAWWLDATEPDIHSNLSQEEYLLRIGPTALGTAARYRNTFSLMNARGIYEGQRQADPDKRVFILTRSAYAGQQRYSAATWSGDIVTRWDNLRDQIPAGLNFCLSGLPYWTTDIGGFAVEPRFEKDVKPADLEEWRELQTRWFQYGTFCPLFRVHGQFPFREMFHIAPDDHPAYQAMAAYDKLRYRLMPYIYSLAGMVTHEDYTIMRALVMDFGADAEVLSIGDQFMFGPALLVSPVTAYQARSRAVYLPAGAGWYDFHSGRYYEGGKTIDAEAPYSDIPLFVKAGSIVPVGPEIQYTTEKKVDPVRLYVYAGQDGRFTLYEDENINTNYEKGAFSKIPFVYNQREQSLTIGDRQGQFPGMLTNRTFEVVWIDPDHPRGFAPDGAADQTVLYEGREITIRRQR